jgi:hypothetical protein
MQKKKAHGEAADEALLTRLLACVSFSCSVACFKQHQAETCKATPTSAVSQTAAAGAAAIAAAPSVATPAVAAPAAASRVPAVAKSATERVADEDLERLASTPSIIAALTSTELQNILRRIDAGGGGGHAGGKGGHDAPPASDEQRVATLDKYRAANSDFEAFVQDVLQVINKE